MSFRVLGIVCVLGLLIAVPTSATELPDIPYEFYTLDNGLEVILHEDHSTPIVGVNTWFHVGSKNEKVGRSGFAHLFEHMMFQGSEHQDAEFFGPLQSVGGLLNGSTSEDRTNYWEILPANHLERALLMEADRLGWLLPAMTQEKFENQQDVVRNERRQSEGRPYSAFWLTFNEQFYPKGHPYDHSVIGIHEDLEAATLEDVKDFFRTYYTPNNATLSIAGDFDSEQVKGWIQDYFGEIPPGPPIAEVATWIPELKYEKRVTAKDRVQLTRIYYAWHTPPYYAEGDADMDLAAKILAGGTTSRLYRRLVHEEQLAQDVSVTQYSQQLTSAFVASITLRPEVDAAHVERIFDEEMARFRTDGPTMEELDRAKTVYEAGFIKGIQRIGSWGGKNDRLNRYNHHLGTPDGFQLDYERFMTRTTDDVRETFAHWIGSGRMVFTIMPMGDPTAMAAASVDRTRLPEGAPKPKLVVPEIDRTVLDNGLEVAVMGHHELPLVQVHLVFRSGADAAPVGLAGIADVTAEMLLEGTKKHDKFAFESELERLGTDLSVYTMDNYTVYELTTLEKHLDASVALLAEAILTPAYPASEFDLQKDRRLVNIQRENDSPRMISTKVTRRLVYGEGHPYSVIGSGTEESMKAIQLSDVKTFAKTNYTPGNAIVVAVGDTDARSLAKTFSRHFSKWSGAAPATANIPIPAAPSGRSVYLVDKPGDTQSTISIAHLGVPRNSADWENIFVVNRLYGGFFSSRLNMNLREDKGYTYGVRSGMAPRNVVTAFTMGGRVQTEVTGPALVEFMKEFEGVTGKRPITQDELDFAKDNIVLGYYRDFETIGQLADAVTEQVVFGLSDDDLARYPEKIAAVDLATANQTASRYYHPDDVAIIVVGDLEKIEDSIRELELGPIRHVDADGNFIDEQELSQR